MALARMGQVVTGQSLVMATVGWLLVRLHPVPCFSKVIAIIKTLSRRIVISMRPFC